MKLIKRISGPDSRIVFDYIYSSVLRHEEKYYGDEELHKNVEDVGEPWGFGVEEDSIKTFLDEHGFRIIEELNGDTLDKRYFTDPDGNLVGRVNASHSIVLAEPIQ